MIELWQYRRFIIGSVLREFRSRHARSVLGAAWLLLSPFAMIGVYTLVFSRIMHSRLPGSSDVFGYSIYLCAGLLPWQWFTELLSRNASLFIDHGSLIKKTTFPRMSLPVITLLSSTCNFLLTVVVFFLFLTLTGHWPGWAIFQTIPLLILQSVFAASLGLALGVLNVFFRDIGHALGIALQFWFWLTPIVYPGEALPEWARSYVLDWNPIAALSESYQRVLLGSGSPLWNHLGPLITATVVSVLLAVLFYRAAKHQIVDEL